MNNDRNQNEQQLSKSAHPDIHEINDWLLYGPKNSRIEELVRALTLEAGMRLSEVEGLMELALTDKLQEFKPQGQ